MAPLFLEVLRQYQKHSTADRRLAELPLTAKGGVRPLRWLVNGQPLGAADPWRREAFWLPDGAGLARITVLDQSGQTASAEVWIRRSGTAR